MEQVSMQAIVGGRFEIADLERDLLGRGGMGGVYRGSGDRSDVGWPLALLAGPARGLSRLSEARRHLCEALRVSVEIRDAITPMYALPVAVLLLADLGEAERAVEIYALASRYGFVANSRLWEDISGREIAALAATLPPDVVAAAQERGRARDLGATVKELLEDLAARRL